MNKISAGILVYRKVGGRTEVLLGHPGGPFWSKKDEASWSIPKGEADEDKDYLKTAKREFKEETGFDVSDRKLTDIGSVTYKNGKVVYAWACEANFDTSKSKSNMFEMEWPPHSGKKISVPEIDKTEYFEIGTALKKINPAQSEFIEHLQQKIG